MALSRAVIVVCVLAMLRMGFTVNTENVTEIFAIDGDDVLLPCPCSNSTLQVTWQIGNTVVNHYAVGEDNKLPPDNSYKNRSRLFFANEKGNCNLHLLRVSFSDQKIFTCHTFSESFKTQLITLTVKNKAEHVAASPPPSPSTCAPRKFSPGVTLGVSLPLVVILASCIITILLIRKRRQQIRQDLYQDPQKSEVTYTPV